MVKSFNAKHTLSLACVRDPAYVQDPSSTETNDFFPRLVLETWLMFGSRLLYCTIYDKLNAQKKALKVDD